MFAIRRSARWRGPRDGSRPHWENRNAHGATAPHTRRSEAGHSRRIARSTAVFSAATAVSRVLGLVREMVSAYFFGVTGLINAFTVAILIPNVVRALLADAALSGAFVPVFSELLEKGERQRAWRVASTLFWLTLLVLGGVTALFILLAPLLMRPFGDPGGDYDLAVGLSRVLFPIVVLLGLSGIVVGILNTYHHFALPALAPVAWNVVIIVGLLLGVPQIDDESARALPLCRPRGGRDAGAAPPADPVASPPRRTADDGHRLARSGGEARAGADAAGHADDRARQRELPRRHAVRVEAPRPGARAGGDRQGVPAVHAAAGHLRRRRDDGALPDARAVRGAQRRRRAPARARRRDAPDRVPPRAGGPALHRPRRADRPARLPARRVHLGRHRDRGAVPAGVLDRPRLQRLDADPQPQLLRRADELGADRHRPRRRRAQRRASTRSSTGSGSGGSRWRRRP